MLSKKQTHTSPRDTDMKHCNSKGKDIQIQSKFINLSPFNYTLFLVLSLTAWLLLLFFYYPSTNKHNHQKTLNNFDDHHNIHKPFLVYIYNLPSEFNLDLLSNCTHLNVYTNMCPHVANYGLGQSLPNMDSVFATNQFTSEVIFHARMENHPFRTWDPSRANLFYVPFYGGLHASSKVRETNLTLRDELAVRLVKFLQSQPWWQRHHGKDHFMVLGRTAWDFMRTSSQPDHGANCLLNLPRVKNMSVLTVERHPWEGLNQHGIPYPSYFHPTTSHQMLTWHQKIRESKRPHLYSFIGAPRKGLEKAAIRDELIKQCSESTLCKLVTCKSEGKLTNKCYEPSEILEVMSGSQFCLQAPGDSFTRRSTFDSMLAGCIPVFFSQHTAYSQYAWFLPDDPEEYSVYIDEKKGNASRRIEDELMKIPRERVERMRNRVIDLIPRVTYKHPNASDDDFEFKDAVDAALEGLAKHVQANVSLTTIFL